MTHGDGVGQVVHLQQEVLGEDWDVPVEHAHAAFERAVSGPEGAPSGSDVSELARRRRSKEPSDGG
jgi:hypothetical protein